MQPFFQDAALEPEGTRVGLPIVRSFDATEGGRVGFPLTVVLTPPAKTWTSSGFAAKDVQWLQSCVVTPHRVTRSPGSKRQHLRLWARRERRCFQRMQRSAPAPAQAHRVESSSSVSSVSGLLSRRRRKLSIACVQGSTLHVHQPFQTNVCRPIRSRCLKLERRSRGAQAPAATLRVSCQEEGTTRSQLLPVAEEAQPVGTCAERQHRECLAPRRRSSSPSR